MAADWVEMLLGGLGLYFLNISKAPADFSIK